MPSTDRLDLEQFSYGSKEVFVVPGLSDAPGDWGPLAAALRQTLIVPHNPFHTGKKERGEGYAWLEIWREQLKLEIVQSGCLDIIAHSRGCLDALLLARYMKFNSLILLTMPTAEKYKAPEKKGPTVNASDRDQQFFDHMLGQLCIGMDPAVYAKLFERHWQEYGARFKEIMRRESPEKMKLPEELPKVIKERRGVMAKLFYGTDDPWDDPKRRQEVFATNEEISPIEFRGGHFPHIDSPEILATHF